MISFIRRQEGQSLVEFALVIPIFLLLLFGIIEFGRIWETKIGRASCRERV